MSTVLIATGILEEEYFLEFPETVRKKMNIKRGSRFFTSAENHSGTR